jgi:hypothetical protein
VDIVAAPPLDAASRQADESYLVLSGGAGQALSRNKLAVFGAEFRFRQNYLGIHPYVLGAWSAHGATFFGGGLLYNIDLPPRWRITVGTGPGHYERSTTPNNLGYPVEFYSNVEVSTKVWYGHRIGLSFGHISNARLSHHNPGSESLRLMYEVRIL